MKVAAKLSIGFLLVVLLIWFTVYFAQNTYNRMQAEFGAVEEEIVPDVVAISGMETLANQIAYEIVAYINTGKEEDKQAIILAAGQLEAAGQEYLARKTNAGPAERDEAETLVTGTDAFASSAVELVRLKGLELVSNEVLLEEAVYPLFPPMMQRFEDNKAFTMEKLAVAEAAAQRAYTSGLHTILLIAGLVTVLAVVVALLISRSITRPLHALHRGTEIIGQGDLNYRVGTRVKDEIGQLSRAFDRMTDNLRNSTASIESLNKEIAEREQAEQALADEATRWRILIDQSLDGIVILDEGAKVCEANLKFAEMLGYTLEEVQELHAWDWDTQWSREELLEMSHKIDEAGFHLETYHQRKDGSTIDVEISANGVVFGGQRFSFCVCRDITERKKAEEQIQHQNEFLNTVLDSLSYPFYVVDASDYTVKLSNQAAKAEGLPETTTCYSLIYKTDKPCGSKDQICPLEEVKKTKKAVVVEHTHYDGNGSARNIEVHGYPIFDAKGNVVQMIEYSLDITERKQMEKELQESQRFSSSLLQNSPNPVVVLDLDTSIRYVNPAFEKLTGFSLAEILGAEAPYPWWPEEDREERKAGLKKTMKLGGKISERLFQKKNGERFWVAINSTEVKYGSKQPYFLMNWLDITERKRAEEQLRDSQEELQRMFESVTDGIVVASLDGTILKVNEKAVKMHGFASEDEMIGKKALELAAPAEHEKMIKNMRRAVKQGKISGVEYTLVKADGTEFPAELSTSALKDASGGVIGHITIARDVTRRKQMLGALRESEEKFSKAFQASPDAIAITRLRDGLFLEVNDNFTTITGYTREETINHKANEIGIWARPEERDRMVKMLEKQGRVQNEEFDFRKKSGELRVWLFSSELIDVAGEKCLISMTIDITERKRAEEQLRESEERYRDLFENASDLIQAIKPDGRFLYVNRAWRQTLGYSAKEIHNLSVWDVIHPDHLAYCQSIFQKVMAGEQGGNIETVFLAKDGRPIVVEGNSNCQFEDGEVSMVRGIFRDITERKQAEEERKQRMEELRIAYERLKELDRLKDSFLSTVSHELRTPLTSIKSFSEILLTYDEDRETQKEFLNIIKEESDRLTRLINDFLDLAKIESGRMQWETVELSVAEVIKTAINATQALAAQGKLEVKVKVSPGLPTVRCDKDRLVQVVTNLLSNAIKFTPEGGKIEVKARIGGGGKSKEKSDAVVISVTDSGIGIDPKDHESVFEKFKQVGDTLTDKPKGTGLGLPICKEIIEHYGGKLWVESQLGKGSTFFFSLPLAPAAGAEAPEAGEMEKPARVAIKGQKAVDGHKTIMVVDDEANIRRFLSHELKKRGYTIIQASGGDQAVELARKHHPDLITLDVLMGGMSGFDVTAVLKNDPETKDIPILIVSVMEDRKRAYQLGVNDYLTKPFKIEALLEKVSRLLRDAQKKIMVVDDDRNLVKSLKYQLGKRGYSASVAYNGKLALKKVNSQPPDLILLDIMMPEMDGYEVMKALKHKPETAQIPILVMTGVEIDGSRVKALSVGATEYFTKSGGFSKMFQTIDSILSGHSEA